MTRLIITGTDTGVGKTIVAAGLATALKATYWKPVQSGLEDTTDTEIVTRLAGCPTLPETYRLNLPASPHLSAEDMGLEIDPAMLQLPEGVDPLIVEGAGGVMVPLNRRCFYLDLFAQWQLPVVLVARTALGTINHTALTLMALRQAGCPVKGVIFNGDPIPEVEQTIVEMCDIAHLGRLPMLNDLNSDSLLEAMQALDLARIGSAA